MSKRQVNEQLFKLIVKIMVENDNRLWNMHLLELVGKNCTLDAKYIFDFILIMIQKDLLLVELNGDTPYLSLSKEACDKVRELNTSKQN